MSVNESERGKGKFDVLIKANGLAVYTIRITKNPKIFLPEYQTALTNDIIHTAKEIFTKAWTANNIRVGDEPRNWLERKKLQQEAARECNNLLALIQIAKPLYHLTSKRVKYWGQKTIEVRQALRDWNAGDTMGFEFNPKKTHVYSVGKCIPFLGFNFKLDDKGKVVMLLKSDNVKRERKKLRRLVNKCKRGEITKEKVNVCYAGWRVHAEKGDSKHLLDRMDKFYKDLWKGAK